MALHATKFKIIERKLPPTYGVVGSLTRNELREQLHACFEHDGPAVIEAMDAFADTAQQVAFGTWFALRGDTGTRCGCPLASIATELEEEDFLRSTAVDVELKDGYGCFDTNMSERFGHGTGVIEITD